LEKGKYGIKLRTYGILAFLFAIVGFTTGLLLLAAAVLFLEKDETSGVTVLTALLLTVFNAVVVYALSFLNFIDAAIYDYDNFLLRYGVISLLQTIVQIVFVVFAIVGLTKAAGFLVPEIPVATEMARKAFGLVAPTPQNFQQPASPYGQPGAPYGQPQQAQAPYGQPAAPYGQPQQPPYQPQQPPYQPQQYPPQNPPTNGAV